MKKYIHFSTIALSLGLMSSLLAGAAEPTHQDMAQAAGYKAMFTCSATFNGGKSPDMIAAQELTNIYNSLDTTMERTGNAVINMADKYVSVWYTDALPPRISAWRPHLGCTALPQGVGAEFIEHLPRVKLKPTSDKRADILWPNGDKLPNTPLPDGVDESGLQSVINKAFGESFDGGEYNGATTAIVITQNGRLLGEKYLEGYSVHTSQRTWSVAKSIAVSIIGAAQHKGYINVRDKTGLKAWSRTGDPRGEITTENLFHMGSGLDSRPAGNRTDNIYMGGGLVAQYATKNQIEAPPGTRWRYANNDTMLSMRVLRENMDNDRRFLAFPFKAVLHKIGMYHTMLETDWDGDFILSSQVWTTARDLARLGQLYLNDGVWGGRSYLARWLGQVCCDPCPGTASKPSRQKCENTRARIRCSILAL